MNEKCAEEILCDEIEIKSPGMLVEVVKDIKELISAGKMKQVGGSTLIDSIPDDPPFNQDVISMFFESVPNGTKYFLNCETYHGSGGIFSKGTPQEWRDAFLDKRIKK